MNRNTIAAAVLVVLVACGVTGWFAVPARGLHRGDQRARYEVTVTNLTRGQIMSPAVVATHGSRMAPIFVPGAPASDALAAVAEDAVNDPLIETLEGDPAVLDVAVVTGENGPILPGESASATLETRLGFRHVSLVGMLVTTNDAFYGLSGVRGPFASSTAHMVPAYDAGSEANNESCEFIPGPPCGNGGVRATEGAEGYVHIHAGIHGVGDLDPAVHDWRNPVARITIRKVR